MQLSNRKPSITDNQDGQQQPASSLTKSDTKELRKLKYLLGKLHTAEGGPRGVPPLFSPETLSLVCMPREVAQEKLVQIISSVNLVSALMLSGIAGWANEQVDVAALPEDKQSTGNLINLLVSTNATINAGLCIFSTYIMMGAIVETPATILRTCARSGCLVVYETLTFVAGFLFVVSIALTSTLRSTHYYTYIIPMAVGIIWLAFIVHGFLVMVPNLMPISAVHWIPISGLMTCPSWCKTTAKKYGEIRLMEAAKVHGDHIVAEAKEQAAEEQEASSRESMMLPTFRTGSGTGSGTGSRGASRGTSSADVQVKQERWSSSEESDLDAFVTKALPRASSTRRRLIVVELLEMGFLTQDLIESESSALMIALKDENFSCELRASERLCICTEAARRRRGGGEEAKETNGGS
jgi:hypothetical protein